MKLARIVLISAVLGVLPLVGPAAPAQASCTDLGTGCVEQIPCKVAASVGIHLNCIH